MYVGQDGLLYFHILIEHYDDYLNTAESGWWVFGYTFWHLIWYVAMRAYSSSLAFALAYVNLLLIFPVSYAMLAWSDELLLTEVGRTHYVCINVERIYAVPGDD